VTGDPVCPRRLLVEIGKMLVKIGKMPWPEREQKVHHYGEH
jgi:hypothetical protein